MNRRRLAVLLIAAGAAAAPYGCSGQIAPEGPVLVDASVASDASATRDGPAALPDARTTLEASPSTPCNAPSLSGFQPVWKQPTPLTRAICSTTQVEAIVSCVLDSNADPGQCKAVLADQGNAQCTNCLFTPESALHWGPLIGSASTGVRLNVGGCVAAMTGDASPTSCAAKLDAPRQCVEAACSESRPCSTCADDARKTVCANYVSAAHCADALLAAGGAAAKCAPAMTPLETGIRLGKLFCSATTDGG